MKKVTTEPGNYRDLFIKGEYLLWTNNPYEGQDDVFLYDLRNGELRRITKDSRAQWNAVMEENNIVWVGSRHQMHDMYLYALKNKAEPRQLTPLAGPRDYPAISEDKIVWMEQIEGEWNIYLYNLGREEMHPLVPRPQRQRYPSIHRGRVVWQELRGRNNDIYFYDLKTGRGKWLVSDPAHQRYPCIYGEYVVWQDERHKVPQIHLYELKSGKERRLAPSEEAQIRPIIWGTRVAWFAFDPRKQYWKVYLHDLRRGKTKLIASKLIHPGTDRLGLSEKYLAWTNAEGPMRVVYVYAIK